MIYREIVIYSVVDPLAIFLSHSIIESYHDRDAWKQIELLLLLPGVLV